MRLPFFTGITLFLLLSFSGGILAAHADSSPVSELEESQGYEQKTSEQICVDRFQKYSWPTMAFLLGLIDGFNPCAMWSLLVLLGFLMSMEDRRRRWIIGGIFLASSGFLYGTALLGYLFGFKEITLLLGGGMMFWLLRGVGVVSIVSAGFSFWAFFQNKVECEIRDVAEKKKFHDRLSRLLKKENLFLVFPGIILLAFSVNAIELLCSFAIPTAFVATLLQMDLSLGRELLAIGIYDMAYMLDDVLVFVIAMKTLSYASFSPKMVRYSHFFAGVLLLVLGLLLITNVGAITAMGLFDLMDIICGE